MKKNLNYQQIGKEVIQFEINALKSLKSYISKSFSKVVKLILNCKDGKVILSGVGKSGVIARKWAATLSSTGTPSFFLDAADASHGDMGQITSKDIVILISNSGESDELKNIIQYTSRNKNIKLIGITSKKNSILFKSSDVSLLMPRIKEAGPENIVPTSSTTNQLALGDAIAIACMRYKKFTKFDFKKIHPSGSLGPQLKTVEDIMITGNKIPFVNENLKTSKALKILSEKKLGILIVRDKANKTKGIVTDGNIRRVSQKNSNFQKLLVKEIMTKKPISVDKNELAAKALSIMNSKKITSLIVFDKKKPNVATGVVHVHTILKSNIS